MDYPADGDELGEVGDPGGDDAILGEESTMISNQQVVLGISPLSPLPLPLQAAGQPQREGAEQEVARGAQGGGRQAQTEEKNFEESRVRPELQE